LEARRQNFSLAQEKNRTSVVRFAGIGVFILILAGASYLMRMIVPIGKSITGFPTLAYLPQYVSFFVLGIVAYRRDWIRTLPVSRGVAGACAAAASFIFVLPPAFSGKMFSLSITNSLNNAFGGGHWQSALYALWDSVFSVGIVLALLTLYRWLFNRNGRLGTFLSHQSYAVYLVHIPVVVYLSYLIRSIDFAVVPKFLVATAIITPVCFGVAYVIRKIPGVSRVI
jgi:glucans biosynthesis protein C